MCTAATREDLQHGFMKVAGIEFWHLANELVERAK
jgi:hypothetical protein